MRHLVTAATIVAAVVIASTALLERSFADDSDAMDQDALVELGRRLFHEPAASSSGGVACADCHLQDHAYSDSRVRSRDGSTQTPRHSQTLLDIGATRLHWDGEFDSLTSLLFARLDTPGGDRFRSSSRLEANYRGPPVHVPRGGSSAPGYGRTCDSEDAILPEANQLSAGADFWLRLDDRYGIGFEHAFGDDEIEIDRVVAALDAFVRTLQSGESPYDRFAAGDPLALTASARRGHGLFRGKARCVTCHALDEGRAITDGQFHRTGIVAAPQLGVPRDVGAAAWTGKHSDTRKFKTPNLRDVARRPPYMHTGSLATLERVIEHYDQAPSGSEITPLGLSAPEKQDLVAFLGALSTDRDPSPTAPRAPRECRIRVVDLAGEPISGLLLTVAPAGGHLTKLGKRPHPEMSLTDADGVAPVELPASTHFRVLAAGHDIGGSRPLPDWTEGVELIATPTDRASVRVRWMLSSEPPETLRCRADRSDRIVELQRVRDLGDHDVLYAGPRAGRATMRVGFVHGLERDDGSGGLGRSSATIAARIEMDLRGGASDPIVVVSPRSGIAEISTY